MISLLEREETGLDVMRSSGEGENRNCVVLEEDEDEVEKKDNNRLSDIIPNNCGLCASFGFGFCMNTVVR